MNKLNKFFEMVGRAFDEAMKNHEDLVILVDGRERTGKSALARSLAYYLRDNHGARFGLSKNVYFTVADVAMMFKSLRSQKQTPAGTIHIIDEAQNVLHHRRSMSTFNVLFDEAIKSIGALRQVFIFCTPAFWELDILHRRTDILVHVYRRGYAGAWIPPRLWQLFSATMTLKRKTKIVSFSQIVSQTGIVPTMNFHFSPPGDEADYNKLKNKHIREFASQIGDKIIEKLGIALTFEQISEKIESVDLDELVSKVVS
ncbi:hypothetical protein [Thermococcus prieurii]